MPPCSLASYLFSYSHKCLAILVDDMAAERVTCAVNELIKEAVLAAVREELAAHKEEVDELRRTLLAAGDQSNATAVVEREREFAIVKGELAAVRAELEAVKEELEAVKGELAKYKDAMAEQRAESSRASGVRGLGGRSKKRKQETSVEFGREEERKEVQGLDRPCSREESAACKEQQAIKDLMLNVELEIRQSEGDQKKALEVSACCYFLSP
ncbi:unnamed protein product [Closterium sp. Naga37s-1]|nr:unnamed protein product [Closterium sp. Naga37s-1]CAI5499763.1 unnamed protein product [Closterium sp. Naga37s-1]